MNDVFAAKLRIAIPKGSLKAPTLDALAGLGFSVDEVRDQSRKLRFSTPEAEFIVARASDVPTFVKYGAVDIGFVGKDVLMERGEDVFELLDVGYGKCDFVVAEQAGFAGATAERYAHLGQLRVATKYPRVAERYFASKGRQVEIIKLYGNVELAPLVGLAEQIVDLVSTGKTLAENNLLVVEKIAPISCRLIANYVSYKLKCGAIDDLVARLKEAITETACS